MEPLKPDYSGANVANLMPALLGARPVDWLPAAVTGARAVVLLVLDGLGWDLSTSAAAPSEFAAMDGIAITTVVPSTTPAALTSITTGLTPAEHGVTGYRMRVDDDGVLNVIRWNRANARRAPDPTAVQRAEPFRGRPVPVVTKHEFRNSGFTAVHLRGAEFYGWQTTSVLVEHVRALIARGEPLVYAYYPGVDEVGHAHGLGGAWMPAELAAAGRLVGAVVDAVPDDVAVVVTADHGQVQVGPDGWIGLGAIDSLVDVYAGDGRFRHLHARSGAGRELFDEACAQFGEHAWVFTRDSLLDEGWMGPHAGGPTRRRVGDVVLAAKEGSGFVDPTWPREANLMAAHGSLTPNEIQVPLLAIRGHG
jgi:hypothetical protein